jgi:hypothetical protein
MTTNSEALRCSTRALGDDLRHGLGGVILCQLPAARKEKRERGYDFARIGGCELVVGISIRG